MRFLCTAVTLYRAPDASTNTHADRSALPFARRYWGISVDFFPGYLEMFQFPGSPH